MFFIIIKKKKIYSNVIRKNYSTTCTSDHEAQIDNIGGGNLATNAQRLVPAHTGCCFIATSEHGSAWYNLYM